MAAAGARHVRLLCAGPVARAAFVVVAPARRRQGRSAAARAASTDATSAASASASAWIQKSVTLAERPRGVHLITRDVLEQVGPEIATYDVGLANLHLLHTSAGLSINENACAAVRRDLARFLDALAPDGPPRGKGKYEHDDEGGDDMPAHIKGVLTGFTLTVPITKGRLALGTWQGIYLFESRDRGGPRSMVVTLQGSRRADGRRYA